MITPDFFDRRWNWYAPILERGDDPAGIATVRVRRYPLRFATPDAREAIPYALALDLGARISGAIQRLGDYTRRYLIQGEKVSLHRLPQMDTKARARVGELRKWYPHLPVALLHHWCADPMGAEALFSACHLLWRKAWRQEEREHVPWVRAVNILVLKLLAEAVRGQARENPEQIGHAMLSVAGHLFEQEALAFLRERAGGEVDHTRLASYEAVMIPITPMVFIGREIPPALLAEDATIIRLYGLEPELVPRMRRLREKLGRANERGMLNLLARDRLGNHLLRRSWARLSFWDLAVRTREGRWMRYVFDIKLLDRLLLRGEAPDGPLLAALRGHAAAHPFARWVLACMERKGMARETEGPWVSEMRVLDAFRVFEEDVRVEAARREAEGAWTDRREALVGRLRGGEAEKRLVQAWREGEIVWFSEDLEEPLHTLAQGSLFAQACLRVSWSAWLAEFCAQAGEEAERLLERQFLPGVLGLMGGEDEIYLEAISGEGCVVRGDPLELLRLALRLRARLHEWWQERAGDRNGSPAMSGCPMGIAVLGDWMSAEARHGKQTVQIRFSMALAQADAMLSRDCGVGRLMAAREAKRGRSIGGVRVEPLAVPEGAARCLHNDGIALSPAATSEIARSVERRGKAWQLRVPAAKARAALAGMFVPDAGLRLLVLLDPRDEEPIVLRHVGKPCVGGTDLELYEAITPDQPAGAKLVEAVRRWIGA